MTGYRPVIVLDAATRIDDGTSPPGQVAHYADRGEDVLAAMIAGTEVAAMCGHRWCPVADAPRLPVCAGCASVLESILAGE